MTKKVLALISTLCVVMLFAACGKAEYEEIDLSKQVPVENYEQYIRLNDSLLGISDKAVLPDVYEGRIGKKIGTVGKVSTKISQNGEVASTGEKGLPLIQEGDEIHRIRGTSPKTEVLIQTKEGYVSASFLLHLDKK